MMQLFHKMATIDVNYQFGAIFTKHLHTRKMDTKEKQNAGAVSQTLQGHSKNLAHVTFLATMQKF